MPYIYGREEDIKRLIDAAKNGGVHPCKLYKVGHDEFLKFDDAYVCDIDAETASTICARYFKGIGSHKDNMVMEIHKAEEKQIGTTHIPHGFLKLNADFSGISPTIDVTIHYWHTLLIEVEKGKA